MNCRPLHTSRKLKAAFRRRVIAAYERGDRAALDQLRDERGI